MMPFSRDRLAGAAAEVRATLADVAAAIGRLLAIELVFLLLSAIIVLPVAGYLLSRLVRTTGDVVVSNTDLIGFLLSPQAIAGMLVIIAARLAARFAQFGAVVLALSGAGRPGLPGILMTIARRLPGLAHLGAMQAALLALAAAPWLAAIGVSALLLADHDINYYLDQTPPRFWIALAIAGLAAAGGAICVGLVYAALAYAVPAMLLEGAPPRAALRRSWGLFRQAPGRLLGRLLVWAGAIAAVAAAGAAILHMVETVALGLPTSITGILLVVSGLLAIELAATLVISMLAFAAHVTIVLRLFVPLSGAPSPALAAPVRSPRLRLLGWGSLAALVAGSSVIAGALVERYPLRDQRTLVIAHRGSSSRAPENTLPAVEAAIEDGADIVEFDVRLTRDGALVLMHDADLMRIARDPRRVADLTLAELRAIDVGASFGAGFPATAAPTLEEVIDAARGRVGLLIELKPALADGALARAVAGALRRADFDRPVMVMSLDARELAHFRAAAPHVPAGLTVGAAAGDLPRADADFIAISAARLRFGTLDRLRDAGKRVHVWTLNDQAAMQRFLSLGVDAMITDEVALAVQMRNQWRDLSAPERALVTFRYRGR
ncbi:MAG: glycerophosphodiester phosphodiesterase [Phycisphaerales bacterium JB039]